jgi:hypothetical protein
MAPLSLSLFPLALILALAAAGANAAAAATESSPSGGAAPVWSPSFLSFTYSTSASRTRTSPSSRLVEVTPDQSGKPAAYVPIDSKAPYIHATIALSGPPPSSAAVLAYLIEADASASTSASAPVLKALVCTPSDTKGEYKLVLDGRAIPSSASVTLLAGASVWRGALVLTGDGPASESVLQKWEEKRHTFGSESRRPFALIPLVFSAAASAPLLVLGWGWRRAIVRDRVKIEASGVPFLAALAAMLLLFLTYWLRLTLFAAIRAGALIALVMVFTGLHALRQRSAGHGPETNKLKKTE